MYLLLKILLLHLPAAALLVPVGYGTHLIGAVAGGLLTAAALTGYFLFRGTLFLRILNGLILMVYSAVFIQQQMGRIEMHFHIFGALAFLVAYRDWKVLLPAAGLIAVHHGVFNYCQENEIAFGGIIPMVFSYGTGWDIVIVHAFFVIFETSILIVYAYSFESQMDEQYRVIHDLKTERDVTENLVKEVQAVAVSVVKSAETIASMMDEFVKSSQDQAATLEEMASGMDEISASIDSIASNTREESESLNYIETKMQELTASTQTMSQEIHHTDQLVRSTNEHARQGDTSLLEMISSMDHISESSQKMLGIVGMINEIADRVNLLSLNASIEAARAGDAGRGFAVVAEEISKLADQTATSIKGINDLIKESTEEIERGKDIVGQNSDSIKDIISDVEKFGQMIGSLSRSMSAQLEIYKIVHANINSASLKSKGIKSSTEEQKMGIDEILQSIVFVSQETQKNVAKTEELRGLAEENQRVASSLRDRLNAFRRN